MTRRARRAARRRAARPGDPRGRARGRPRGGDHVRVQGLGGLPPLPYFGADGVTADGPAGASPLGPASAATGSVLPHHGVFAPAPTQNSPTVVEPALSRASFAASARERAAGLGDHREGPRRRRRGERAAHLLVEGRPGAGAVTPHSARRPGRLGEGARRTWRSPADSAGKSGAAVAARARRSHRPFAYEILPRRSGRHVPRFAACAPFAAECVNEQFVAQPRRSREKPYRRRIGPLCLKIVAAP